MHNPAVCRSGRRCDPQTIEEAIACAALHSEKPAKAVADDLQMTRGLFYAMADPQRSDLHFHPARLLALMQATGNVAPLRFLAAQMNCAVVELPAPDAEGDVIYERLSLVVQELGEDSAAIRAALEDGYITPLEAHRIDREIGETVDALLALGALVRARVGRPAPARMAIAGARARAEVSA